MTDELGAQLTNIKEEIGDIKRSLSRISDALEKLARVEERQASQQQAINRIGTHIDRIETRLLALERSEPSQRKAAEWIERLSWLAVVAVLSYVALKTGLIT